MNLKEQDFLDELWLQLERKITNDWDKKYSEYGSSIYNVTKPHKFAQRLYEDIIEHRVNSDLPIDIDSMISVSNLDRLIKRQGISPNIQSKTKIVLLEYLGYSPYFKDFKDAHRAEIIKRKQYHTDSDATNLENASSSDNFDKRLVILISLFVLIIGITAFLVWKNYSDKKVEQALKIEEAKKFEKNKELEKKITKIINEANALDFALSNVPPDSADLALIDKYFHSKGTARAFLNNTLRNLREKPRRFAKNESSYSIRPDFKFIKKDTNLIIVHVHEIWNQFWYDTSTTPETRIPHQKSGFHEYHLQKEDALWKIVSNNKLE